MILVCAHACTHYVADSSAELWSITIFLAKYSLSFVSYFCTWRVGWAYSAKSHKLPNVDMIKLTIGISVMVCCWQFHSSCNLIIWSKGHRMWYLNLPCGKILVIGDKRDWVVVQGNTAAYWSYLIVIIYLYIYYQSLYLVVNLQCCFWTDQLRWLAMDQLVNVVNCLLLYGYQVQ